MADDKLDLVGARPLPPETVDRSGASGDEQLVELWLNRQQSPATQRSYAFVASTLLDHLTDRQLDLRSCTVEAMDGWFEGIEGKPATRKQRLAAVKSLLSFGQSTGYLTYNVGSAFKLPRVPNDLAERLLSELEVQKLLDAAKGRTKVLMSFLYYSAARIEEALGLCWENIHSSELDSRHVITLHGKGGKTRHVTVGDPVFQGLCSLITVEHHAPDKLVFVTRTGRPLAQQSARDSFKRVAKRAGLAQKVSPHWLRHAHASHALDHGAPVHLVQATLGHSSLDTTSRYAHAKPGASSTDFLREL
jgi:site-specific recombinase XerD